MSWPLSQDYNEAIQSPRGSFTDDELRNAEPILNALGIPLPCSGNFADVYPMRSARGSWAVKCFTREVPGLRERYAAISRHLRGVNLPFAVDFTFLEQGIRVRGQWYPVLKMQWVEGLTLNAFVRQYADKPATMKTLLQIWVRMAARLREAGIAHADLQHGNILLVPGSTANSLAVKLIDYDGMWIPALAKTPSGEVGHPCYQHPQRGAERTYSQELDRFPLLLVATALDCLRVGGQALWEKYDSGDNLLFRETDLQAPTKSPLFHELLKLGDGRASNLVRRTFDALRGRLESAPLLEEVLPELYAAPASKPASKPTTVVKMAAGQPAAEAASASASAWDFGDEAKEPSRRSRKRGTPRWVWGVAGAGVAALVLAGGIFALAFRGGSGKPKDEARIARNDPTKPTQRTDRSSKKEAPNERQPNGDGQRKEDDVPSPPMEPPVREAQGAGGSPTESPTENTVVSARAKSEATPATGSPADDKGFVPLFNGKDLTGWEGLTKYWSVKDGGIVGYMPEDSKQSTFLCSKKKYSDFELQFKVRLKDGVGNSGVQIRSTVTDRAKFVVAGPQCDIGVDYWGDLYGEGKGWGYMMKQSPAELVNKVVKNDDFNDYYIKCAGKHVTIKINGETMVDVNFPTMPEEGIIAFQLHAGFKSMEVTFKDIKFTDLSKPRAETPPATQVAAEEKGFVPLFNGKDTTGWRTHPNQPGNWRVEKGVLIGSGSEVSHLYTKRGDYKDFHLRVETRINDGGNSGVYSRATFGPFFPKAEPIFPIGYEAQIAVGKRGDPVQTGSLFAGDGALVVNLREPPVPTDQWFTMDVIAEGNHIVVKVDGKTTADFWDKEKRSASGYIALQQLDARTVVEFRKIEIKELSAKAASSESPKPPAKDSFVPLFNGNDLSNWTVDGGIAEQWSVEGDTIVGRSSGAGTRSYLLTDKEFANFALRFDFKVEDGNHGVAIRAIKGEKMPLNDNLIFDHPLIKLMNPAVPSRDAKEATGTTHWLQSAETFVKPSEVLSLPRDAWHSMEVVVQGDSSTATIANKRLVNVTLDRKARKREDFIPGLQRVKGRVGFQTNTGTVRFRNVAIKELPAESSPSRAQGDHPPDAKEAAVKAYEKACADARTKLLAAFDAEVDKLAKQTGSAEARLKWIDVLKEEKRRFENRGWIPWSARMRPHVERYLTALKAAQRRLGDAYDSLIGVQLRAKNESKVAELRADLKYRLDVKVMAKWNFFINGRLHHTVVLYSNGAIENKDGKAAWSYGKGVLVFVVPAPNGPGGAWINTLNVSLDGTTYEGTNNDRPERRPKLTGVYVKDD